MSCEQPRTWTFRDNYKFLPPPKTIEILENESNYPFCPFRCTTLIRYINYIIIIHNLSCVYVVNKQDYLKIVRYDFFNQKISLQRYIIRGFATGPRISHYTLVVWRGTNGLLLTRASQTQFHKHNFTNTNTIDSTCIWQL